MCIPRWWGSYICNRGLNMNLNHSAAMYTAEYMETYRLPEDMASYDVGVRYNSPFRQPLQSLHDNNKTSSTFNVNIFLNKAGECQYKVYFRNNTMLRCEILVFIRYYDAHEKYFGYPNNHMIVESDRPCFIVEPHSLDKSYIFVQNCITDTKKMLDLNSYVTVLVYPEKPDMLWHYKYGFKRSNIHYTYKFRLSPCQVVKTCGYFTVSN